jgi:hypothetical protein
VPKATWGGGLTAQDVDNVDTSRRFTPYDGPRPQDGVYLFTVKRMQKAKSQNGNDQVRMLMELKPRRAEEQAYAGCPVWDFIPVMKSTDFRVRDLCDALGVTSQDFLGNSIVNEDGMIVKVGKLSVIGAEVRASIQYAPDRNGVMRLNVSSLIPKESAGGGSAPAAPPASALDADEAAAEPDGEEDEPILTEEQLNALPIGDLKKYAVDNGYVGKADELNGKKKPVIVKLIVQQDEADAAEASGDDSEGNEPPF